MSAIAFVNSLLDTGRVRVGPSPERPADLADAALELDRLARANLAFHAPALMTDVAEWALLVLYRGCQALVYREIEADAVRNALAAPCPKPPSPETCYSADLALQFLPELISLARGIAEDDPLVDGLRALAAAWPLSSVGVRGLRGPLDTRPFIEHPSLRRLYADRIIDRTDVSRLNDAGARDAVRAAIGGFPELAPGIAAALSDPDGPTRSASANRLSSSPAATAAP